MPVLTGSDIPVESTVAAFTRGAVNGLAEIAARTVGGSLGAGSLGAGLPSADGSNQGSPRAPSDPLYDMRLPEPMRSWLKPAADELGLTIEDGTARDRYGRRERRVTYLTNGQVTRTLLYIPPKVLTDANAYDSLGMLMWAMQEGAFVAVFAQGLEAPAPVNANVIDNLWKLRIDSHFIAWPHVSELPTLDLVDQVEFMRSRLGLDAVTRAQDSGVGKVTTADVARIIDILSAQGGFDDARGRKGLLTQAGLSAFAGAVNLDGSTNDVGIDLLWKLTRYKDTVPSGSRTALGALLRTVTAFPDIPPTDAGWLKALIARCEL